VQYDIIGESMYPEWKHGTPEQVQDLMVNVAKYFNKPFIIAETGYPQSGGDTIAAANPYYLWPGTPEGQLQFMADLINTVKRGPNGLGVFYWAPEGRGRGDGLWNADGTPDAAISVMDHLTELTKKPASHLPDLPPAAKP
jgi:arabinogalactan endo-1,4-beta-galactosidase